ncbi:MAG: competence/damage-inducible protein A [Alphaproteobacteria bacterium]|nr:competence/damage-inducible protein A [Alphaproteobacteria bacterium]
MSEIPSAAVLVIGDEILSGRTQDTNSCTIARFLASLGIDLKEVRVVGDVEAEIVAAVNALRARYRYVFTTGGIGPTHDDITADAVAKAFGVDIAIHPEALAMLAERIKDLNEARRRMARIPEGASLIKNSVSAAPGFQIGNVFVMAGVPGIMQAMLEDVAPRLARGTLVHSLTVTAAIGEGTIAAGLAKVQFAFPGVAIGSYPYYRPDGFGVNLVARGRDRGAVEKAAQAIEEVVRDCGAEPSRSA